MSVANEAPDWPFVALLVVAGSMLGEVGGADEDDDEADDEDDEVEEAAEVDEADDSDEQAFIDELVDETFLADSAALLRTIRLIDDTEGKLSSSQIPSDCNWFLISQANMVGFAFL